MTVPIGLGRAMGRLLAMFGVASLVACVAVSAPAPATAMEEVGGGRVVARVHGTVPIPVGHRIEIRTFDRGDGPRGLDLPLLVDLDTGVAYGPLAFFHEPVTIYSPGQLFMTSQTVLPTLHERSRWYGRVVSCLVVAIGLRASESQTTLVIERTAASDAPP